MYLLFSKPSELSSARIYKTENILSLRGRKPGGVTIWCDMSCAVESVGAACTPGRTLHQLRLPGAEETEGMKKTAKMPFFSNLLRISARVPTERAVHCSRKFGSSVFISFILFSKVK